MRCGFNVTSGSIEGGLGSGFDVHTFGSYLPESFLSVPALPGGLPRFLAMSATVTATGTGTVTTNTIVHGSTTILRPAPL